jgi:hypothetical protein
MSWLTEAALNGASLAVVSDAGALELYSTEEGRQRAFPAVMASLRERLLGNSDLGKLRVRELSGKSALEHLFNRAAGLEGSCDGQEVLAEIHAAAAAAAASAALGPTLGAVFWAAANVTRRVLQETAIHHGDGESSFRDLYRFEAERIVAEELAAFQVVRSEAHSRLQRRFSVPAAGAYDGEEPASAVRLRVRSSDRLPGMKRA